MKFTLSWLKEHLDTDESVAALADKRWLDHYGFRALDMPTLFGGLSS